MNDYGEDNHKISNEENDESDEDATVCGSHEGIRIDFMKELEQAKVQNEQP